MYEVRKEYAKTRKITRKINRYGRIIKKELRRLMHRYPNADYTMLLHLATMRANLKTHM